MAMKLPCGNQSCILDRLPERLVIEGYRHWLAGFETGSIAPWELVWMLYMRELGAREARNAIADLSDWIRNWHGFSDQTTAFFPFQCKRMCRDECLALTLISALQHREDQAIHLCLERFKNDAARQSVRNSAAAFAHTLDMLGQRLIPVPLPVIADIATRPERTQFH